MNSTTYMIAKLAAAGIVCTGSGYVARPVVDRAIAHVSTPIKKPTAHKASAHRRTHISTRTTPPCAVPILPIAGIAAFTQPLAMMDDDVEGSGTASLVPVTSTQRAFATTVYQPAAPGGGVGIVPTGPGAGPTPTPTSSPTNAPPVTSSVPEPATWAMVVLGMFAAGFALRRATAPAGKDL